MILEKAAATIRRHSMFEAGDGVVVAVSGGPDSVALLHVLLEIARDLPLSLSVAHLDHALRGAASEADRHFVEELAARLGLPCTCARENVAALARREKRSLEDAGRLARRIFLKRAAAERGARRVALGHHRDDQAESVLLRLIAGAGRGGLAGIRPVADGIFVRPLLDCSREEILDYLAERAIRFRTDESNEDPRFPRNRLRHRVFPLLRQEFNPRVSEAIARTAELLREEDLYLERAARHLFRRLSMEPGASGEPAAQVILDASGLAGAATPIARRVVRLALRRAGLAGRDLARDRIEEILELTERQGSNVDLLPGGGVSVRLEYGRLIVAPRAAAGGGPGSSGIDRRRGAAPEDGTPFDVPGEASYAPSEVRIRSRVVPRGDVERELRRAPPERAYLDADLLGPRLLMRLPRPGDRFRPLGAPGARKVSDLFTDLKVPRAARRRCLLIESAGEIAWAAGLRIAHRFRVTEKTRRVAILEWLPRGPVSVREGQAVPEFPLAEPISEPHAGETRPSEREQPGAKGAQSMTGAAPAEATASQPAGRVLYSAADIARAVGRLSAEVSAWAAGRELTVLGILQGSFMFLADLARRFEGPLLIGFLDRQGRLLPGAPSLEGARILLVEDILDTGESLFRVLEKVHESHPAEVRTCVLFDKPAGRRIALEADYRGLLVPNRWVVGYGIDNAGLHRNLPYLTWI